MSPTIALLATSTPPEGAGTPPVRTAVLMFTALSIVLLIGIVMLLLAVLSRRRRRERAAARALEVPSPTPDAWSEAANRIQPFEKPDR